MRPPLRYVLLLVVIAGFGREVPLDARTPYCYDACGPIASCAVECIGDDQQLSSCGNYNGGANNGMCEPHCYPSWSAWSYQSTLGWEEYYYYHWSAGHYDCVIVTNEVWQRNNGCGGSESRCEQYEQGFTRAHNTYQGFCAAYWGEGGTMQCPY